MSSRTNPYRSFQFSVEIDSIIVGGFSEVTGLEVEVETDDYPEGGRNELTHKLPKRVGYPNLVLKRGLTDADHLWQWVERTKHEQIERKTGRIVLLDSTGRQTWAWTFRGAYPVKWTGPELRADQGTVAVETLELAHQGLSTKSGPPSAGGSQEQS